MHNRLIFRYHRLRDKRRPAVAKGMAGPSGPTGTDPRAERRAMRGRRKVDDPRRWLSWGKRVGRGVGKSAPHQGRDVTPSRSLGEVIDPMLPRKAASECNQCPYPKPTQVDR